MVVRSVHSRTTIASVGDTQPVPVEESMSSAASLITLLASVAFGLIVIGVGHRVVPPKQ
jgi:hypothetical protein